MVEILLLDYFMNPQVIRFGNMKVWYILLAGETKPSLDGEEERI
jgi:hypothetical protein